MNAFCPSSSADQPRVRGEHMVTRPSGEHPTGSAPRARGTHEIRSSNAPMRSRRISPACAGNTTQADLHAQGNAEPDQPRVRGEHSDLRPIADCQPRADQPRVRGEHAASRISARLGNGSAPRARGTRRNHARRHVCRRISPACAGNTGPACPGVAAGADQPRVRGEHEPPRPVALDGRGSAPRARGTRLRSTCWQRRTRISPACAGNTLLAVLPMQRQPDQPRVRGEHSPPATLVTGCIGSAPRARGTRAWAKLLAPTRRISPACAGNTLSGAWRR